MSNWSALLDYEYDVKESSRDLDYSPLSDRLSSHIVFKLIDKTIGLRVSKEEEMEGLDSTEHGGNAYPGFVHN